MEKSILLLFILIISACSSGNQKEPLIRNVGPQSDGSVLVPSNQLLRPAGSQIDLPGRPVDLALTPDGKYLLVKNKDDLDLIRLSDRKIMQSLPYEQSGASFTGICVSPDGKTIYVTDADKRICIAEADRNMVLRWAPPIILPAPAIGDSPVPGGLAISDDGQKLFVTISRSNTIGIADLRTREITQVDVGMAPYGIILAGSSKAYVSNWGGRRPGKGEPTYNSSGSQVLVDPTTGVASSGSVSVVDLNKHIVIKEIAVGLHPSGMVLSPDGSKLYVTCANSDFISVINTENDEPIGKIWVNQKESQLFGSSPNSLAISPDGHYLYSANGTSNAISVISTGDPAKVEGSIPTGWYPGSVILTKSGKILYVANVKGTGSRNQSAGRNGFNSHDHLGSLSIIPVPGKKELEKMSEIVTRNNSWETLEKEKQSGGNKLVVPVPVVTGQVSPIKHVIYIIKENRTYDQVFGDIKKANGDTSLVMFGKDVTPNHHKLAEEFVLMDNYYCSGVLSADGHQWADEAFVTDYLEKSFGDFTRSYPYDGDDALAYASSGFIWDNVLKHGLTFRNYGEFVKAEIEPGDVSFTDAYNDYLGGKGKVKISAVANLEQLTPNMCPTFIGFPNNISDQYRASEFLKEFSEYEKKGNLPNFIVMVLTCDHTSGTRPGLPTPKAAVADNDLALGRIVEAVSSSSFWKETAIFVTEDDPQDGLDHVDGHRTVGLVISPYTRKGEVVSNYYSQINMVRTMENILGLPPMNQLDLSAEPMTECFTDKADLTPYKLVKNNIPLDQLNPPLVSLSGDQRYWAEKSMEQDLSEVDRIDEDVFNRIIWHSVKGYDRPYPDNRE